MHRCYTYSKVIRGGTVVAPVRYLLSDLDGTLLDTRQLIVASFRHTFSRCLGLEVSLEEIYRNFGKPLREIMLMYDPNRVEELVSVYRSYNRQNHDRLAHAFPGAVEIIKRLVSEGVRPAIVSSKLRELVLRGLDIMGLAKDISVVVAVEDAPAVKPEPAPLLKALELLGGSKSEALMVGDTPYDIAAAHRAGIRSAAVEWSVFSREELSRFRPNYWFKDWQDILPLIDHYPL